MTGLPRTVAEAARWTPPDEVRSQPVYRAGFFKGTLSALAITGMDLDTCVGEIPAHPGLEAAVARQRETLAEVRSWDRKPPAKTAAQLMAAARHSWRIAEKVIAEPQRLPS